MRRVVITGMGVVAPGGLGTRAFWSLLTAGRTATRGITLFDASSSRSRVAAEADFDPADHGFTAAEAERLDRAAQFALVGLRQAVADCCLPDGLDPRRTGVSMGNAVGCLTSLEVEYAFLSDCGSTWTVDHTKAVPELFDYYRPSSIAAELATATAARGPVALISSGCTSGLDAIGHATGLIREGSTDVMVTGATEAPISPITIAALDAIRVTSARNEAPGTASRPFDRTRDGFVLGEGSAVLVLEEFEHARRRGARPYAEVVGFARRCSAHHMTALRPDGLALADAVRGALDQARLGAGAVDHVTAHGSGTRQNDRHETAALKRSLGAHACEVSISSIKSMIGHSLGASGALDVAASALAIEHGVVPPTANLLRPDPECDLDYTPLTARQQRTDTVLVTGSGFGGFQSALLLARPRSGRAA